MSRPPSTLSLSCALLRRADGSYCPALFLDIKPGTVRLSGADDGGLRTFLRTEECRDGAIVFSEAAESRSGA